MKALIPSLLTAVFATGGAFAGTFFRPAAPVTADLTTEAAASDATEAEGKKKGMETESILSPDYFPMRFARPFVVPVTDGWEAQSIVVLQLNIELHKDVTDAAGGLEQRLRDRVMAALIKFSHDGGFTDRITSPEVQSQVRDTVRDAVEIVLPGKVGDVLVLEIVQRKV